MIVKPSSTLRNSYQQIASLARTSGEPIYITNNGEVDLVVISVDAFEEREKMLEHRASVLDADLSRLSAEPTLTVNEARTRLKTEILFPEQGW